MQIRIWGCRGSVPVPGPATVRYGGNTPCVEVRLRDGSLLVLDAGTGLRALGRVLAGGPPAQVHILLSHLHLDHLFGFPFFQPLLTPGWELHLWGPSTPDRSLAGTIDTFVSPPLFPVTLRELAGQVTLHEAPAAPWKLEGATISAQPVIHTGPTLGYRIQADGATLAYIPDHEPALAGDLGAIPTESLSGYGIAHGADLLLHDSQYTAAEYEAKVGWGHCSVSQAVELARRAEVGRLLLFHHDPAHTDEMLEEMQAEAVRLWTGPEPPLLAHEGMELTVGTALTRT